MTTLAIHNPATGTQITQVPADDATSVAAKFQAARAAQPAWAATPLAQRQACVAGFRAGVCLGQKEVNASQQAVELVARHGDRFAGLGCHGDSQGLQLAHHGGAEAGNAG